MIKGIRGSVEEEERKETDDKWLKNGSTKLDIKKYIWTPFS